MRNLHLTFVYEDFWSILFLGFWQEQQFIKKISEKLDFETTSISGHINYDFFCKIKTINLSNDEFSLVTFLFLFFVLQELHKHKKLVGNYEKIMNIKIISEIKFLICYTHKFKKYFPSFQNWMDYQIKKYIVKAY